MPLNLDISERFIVTLIFQERYLPQFFHTSRVAFPSYLHYKALNFRRTLSFITHQSSVSENVKTYKWVVKMLGNFFFQPTWIGVKKSSEENKKHDRNNWRWALHQTQRTMTISVKWHALNWLLICTGCRYFVSFSRLEG